MIKKRLPHAALLAALLSPAAAGDTHALGFELTTLPVSAPVVPDAFGSGFATVGYAATFSNGDVLVFDGQEVRRVASDGTFLSSLGELDEPTFAAFALIAPGEQFAVVAESSTDAVYRVDLAGNEGMQVLTTLHFAFDAVFEDDSSFIVSAAPCGFSCGNQLIRVDATTGMQTVLAEVDGPSGPVTLDGNGNLYYATIDLFGTTDILRWDAALLTGAPIVDESDAILFASGFAGASALAYDPVYGWLYLAENNSTTNVHRIRRVVGTVTGSKVLVEGELGSWFAQLEIQNQPDPAVFFEFQPPTGGALRYADTHYANATSERNELVPRRTVLEFTGPGTSGTGTVDVELSNGWPGGFYFLLYGLKSTYSPVEFLFYLPDSLPLFTGLDFGTAGLVAQPFTIDANGADTFSFQNHSGLVNALAVQAIVLAGNGDIISTSDPAFL